MTENEKGRQEKRRTVPARCPPVPSGPPLRPGWRRESFAVRVVTPMFGGGPRPGENDPVTLVRGASVRGHLRFWWRATRGAAYRDAKALYEREGAIWGTTKTPSRVTVQVKVLDEGRRVPVSRGHPCAYVLFPFLQQEMRGTQGHVGVVFDLTLEYKEGLREDVMAALWAWVNFGGIGARTRLGCGALFCEALSAPAAAVPQDVRDWYASSQGEYGWEPPAEPAAWPTLPPPDWLVVGSGGGREPERAWAEVVRVLQEFRQGGAPDRRGRRQGRSVGSSGRRPLWPEGRALRAGRLGGRPKSGRAEDLPPGFPRAELGLPIVLRGGERPKTLEPGGGRKRMASPVILKPLVLSSGKALPIALRLRTESLDGVRLGETEYGPESIRNPAFARDARSPLHGRTKTGSALEAFMVFARERLEKGGKRS